MVKLKAANAESFQDWCTPQNIFSVLSADAGGYGTDLFASEQTALCQHYYTAETDGIMAEFETDLAVFGNPPYGGRMIDEALAKAIREVRVTKRWPRCDLLLPASVSAKWFHQALQECEVHLFKGRIQFGRKDGIPAANRSFIPNCLVIVERDGLIGVTATRSAKTGVVLWDATELKHRGSP